MVEERSHLAIGEVLSLLHDEFPDVTISKIRFLESQGLVDPERTPSGYRKFYDADVERLRWILLQQKEHFLPLKVIKDRLAELDDAGLPLDDASAGTESGSADAEVEPEAPSPGEPEVRSGVSLSVVPSLPDRGRRDPNAGNGRGGPTLVAVPDVRGAETEVDASDAEAPDGAPAASADARSDTEQPADSDGTPESAAAGSADVATAESSDGESSGAGSSDSESSGGEPAEGSGGDEAGEDPAGVEAIEIEAIEIEALEIEVLDIEIEESGNGRPTVVPASGDPDTMTLEELAAATGLDLAGITELQQFGLITPSGTVGGTTYFDQIALEVARTAAGFAGHGVEARHLRAWRNSAEREVSIFEQVVMPLLRQRNPHARGQAEATLAELAGLGADLRAALVRQALRSVR
jgi:DNA-binding transcriptional MerR regulator